MEECKASVTAESASRRKMYQVEQMRQSRAETLKHDYNAFLRDCDIRLTILPLDEEQLERAYELTQRTNQMNFSGNRYEHADLREMLRSSVRDVYVVSCEDRFGSYGAVGLGVVDNREPRLIDLMFSCRIQSKRVEHAFVSFLMRKYIDLTGRDFYANYRKTPRNAPSGQVFADLGMRELEVVDGVTSLVFSRDQQIPDDGIIQIDALEKVVAEQR